MKTNTKISSPTQAIQVLDYLKARGGITAATASSVLGIPRLAAVIGQLKKSGTGILPVRIKGYRGSYVEYRLAAA